MLDQLVESKNNSAENTRRSEFLLVTLIIMVSVLLGSWTYSLFNKEYLVGGDLELSTLVAPVALPEEAPPPPPEPEAKPEKAQQTESDKIIVKDTYASIEQTKEPPKELVGAKDIKALPSYLDPSKVVKGDTWSIPSPGNVPRGGDTSGGGIPQATKPVDTEEDDAPPPPKPTPKPVPKIVSGGVVNGKATNLVKPPYPAAARAVRAAGAVNVQVTIDETGNVISASAVSGHPLLRAAAVQAARSSKFSPTMLSGQAVKVTGVIVYNFVP